MRNQPLTIHDPLYLTLSADFRFGQSRQQQPAWQLEWERGEPPALAIYSNLGLKARSCRLFPRFSENNRWVSNPGLFSSALRITGIYPNYAAISFSPFPGLDVIIEYWVPGNDALAIRSTLTNKHLKKRKIEIEWGTILQPLANGEIMKGDIVDKISLLKGKTEDIVPVFLFSGGGSIVQSPYSSLKRSFLLSGNEEKTVSCALAWKPSIEQSIRRIRRIFSRNWDAEIAKIELRNAAGIEIETGNADWNTTFALSKNLIYSSWQLAPEQSDRLSEDDDTKTATPAQPNDDMRKIPDNLSPLELYYIIRNQSDIDCTLWENLLKTLITSVNPAGENSRGDGHPSGNQPLPLLATIALSYYEKCGDTAFLHYAFHPMLENLLSWFDSKNDRDQDGVPEWSSSLQFDIHDHPLFSLSEEKSPCCADITMFESPALCAFLVKECNSLISIAEKLNKIGEIPRLVETKAHLESALEHMWNDDTSIYHYRDRDTHLSTPGISLGELSGNGEQVLNKELPHPSRLMIAVFSSTPRNNKATFFIHGINRNGVHKVEKLSGNQLVQRPGLITGTSRETYLTIEKIVIFGLDDNDHVRIATPNYHMEDISLLLPVWSSPAKNQHSRQLIRRTIMNPQNFLLPYGLATFPLNKNDKANTEPPGFIHPIYNFLIGEALVACGENQHAAQITSKLMRAITRNLNREHNFRQYYDALTGQGQGNYNSPGSIAPAGLFLDTLGIEILSPRKVIVQGKNPYPWPVTLRYRGLVIIREAKKTKIVFPGGQTAIVSGTSRKLVELR